MAHSERSVGRATKRAWADSPRNPAWAAGNGPESAGIGRELESGAILAE